MFDGGLLPRCCFLTVFCCLLFLSGISVVLDLTPNYHGAVPWFTAGDVDVLMEKVMVGPLMLRDL